MGSEERIDTMLTAFRNWVGPLPDGEVYPQFDKEHEYFLIRKGDTFHEELSDNWDGFRAGWVAREEVPESTVEGW